MHIVPLCLDSDLSLIPLSCQEDPSTPLTARPLTESEDFGGSSHSNRLPDADGDLDIDVDAEERDPDDFSFWSEKQAKRICAAIEQVFGVEYASEVVVADANLTTLANRILLSKEILTSGAE